LCRKSFQAVFTPPKGYELEHLTWTCAIYSSVIVHSKPDTSEAIVQIVM
jgi:hypothetical protein